ncbi:MAG: GNAT family N-acetyltransferase [Candidatus Zixiibacteriota bacterium]|nr:MAG: GNAT family N-acetyltransferase [candidate division Zixibacteria bacterium]
MNTFRRTLDELSPETINRLNADSFFSSVDFARLWETQGGRATYFVTEEDGRPMTVLPGVEFGHGPLKRFQSMPDGCYARLVDMGCPADRVQEAVGSTLTAIRKAGYLRGYLYDYYAQLDQSWTDATEDCSSILVDISDEEWQPPDKKLQSEIRKARREAIEVQRFDPSNHLAGFLSLVRMTAARHGQKPRYSDAFFENLGKISTEDERIIWLYTERDKKPAASHINFVLGDTLLNWQVFFDKKFSFLKPNQFMLHTAATSVVSQGVRRLNLGASPEHADTLLTYKQKWGGREYCYQELRFESMLGRVL